MKELEKLLKALADKNRLRILKLLEVRKMCVCELASVLGITQPREYATVSISKQKLFPNQSGKWV